MRIGELCAGYGGLGMGVQAVLGGELAWVSEYEPPSKANPNPSQGAAKILAHRFPDVPNLGDMTAIDWSTVEPVDILTGGTPCQDLSAAGKRLGMRASTRSGLWASMCDAIDTIRPGLVVWENVRGALSAHADSAVEPCPICVGDERDSHLRALGRVVGDLSELGYVGRWTGLRAADVGAPHGRFRVFVVAWPAGDDLKGLEGRRTGRRAHEWAARAAGVGSAADADRDAVREQPVGLTGRSGQALIGRARANALANAARYGRHQGWPEPARLVGGSDAAECGDAAAHPDGDGLCRLKELHGVAGSGREAVQQRHDADGLAVAAGGVDWGAYGPAVHRWERVLGRVAPPPTERGRNGQPRLSPAFVEWLMGLPAGWVTDVPGITRNEALKALGNGVVPQQAAAALRLMLADHLEERAA